MTEYDLNQVVTLYMDHYNLYDDGMWTTETTYKRIHQVLTREDSLCMLLEYNDNIIGFVMGYLEQYDDIQAFDLVEILIAHAFQGQGLGTLFMKEIENTAKELGASMIQLCAINDKMHNHFYEKLGYKNCNNLILKSKWL